MAVSITDEFDTLTVSVDGKIGRLTLNQPEALNPLGNDTLAELAEAAAWFNREGPVVVIVTGAGDRAFSSGFDLRQFAGSADEGQRGADLGGRMADAIEAMDAVTIAAIHGHCIGGGLVLAAACDLRLAADNTNFAIPEVDLGIPLAWGGIPRLVREIGPAMTKELVMTCRPFDAHEGKAVGFVNRVVPRADLESEAQALAESLTEKSAYVLRITKLQVRGAVEHMASTSDGWTGTSHLTAALADPEARAAANRYLASKGQK